MLSLPRIDSDIPLRLVPAAARQRGAHLARVLIQAGLINARTLPARMDTDHVATCRAALAAWLNQRLCGLRCLRPMFSLGLDEAAGIEGAGEHDGYRIRGQIAWYGGGGTWCVGPALECLEAFHARLGMTVLRIIEDCSWRTLPLFTPSTALDVARDFYWYGEEDEETALDMHCGEDDAEREAARAEMVTRDLLDDAFPMWARTWPGRRSREQGPAGWKTIDLRKALPLLSDPRQRSIVTDASALARLRIEDGFRCDCDGEFVGFGAVLSWSESDLTTRVFDDLMQQANEGECHDRMGEFQIVLNTPSALKKWQQAMRPRFKAIGLIDRLIGALSS